MPLRYIQPAVHFGFPGLHAASQVPYVCKASLLLQKSYGSTAAPSATAVYNDFVMFVVREFIQPLGQHVHGQVQPAYVAGLPFVVFAHIYQNGALAFVQSVFEFNYTDVCHSVAFDKVFRKIPNKKAQTQGMDMIVCFT